MVVGIPSSGGIEQVIGFTLDAMKNGWISASAGSVRQGPRKLPRSHIGDCRVGESCRIAHDVIKYKCRRDAVYRLCRHIVSGITHIIETASAFKSASITLKDGFTFASKLPQDVIGVSLGEFNSRSADAAEQVDIAETVVPPHPVGVSSQLQPYAGIRICATIARIAGNFYLTLNFVEPHAVEGAIPAIALHQYVGQAAVEPARVKTDELGKRTGIAVQQM